MKFAKYLQVKVVQTEIRERDVRHVKGVQGSGRDGCVGENVYHGQRRRPFLIPLLLGCVLVDKLYT